MKINNPFTQHPHSIGESYLQHAYFASIFGLRVILAGAACIIHAIFPFLFKHTASNMLKELLDGVVKRIPATKDST